jgi:Putative DNA-binding domain
MMRPPPKRQTLAELRTLQRLAGAVIMRPLAPDWRMQRRWIDQRDMRVVAGEFIKPNDRLTSFERIEIYNRQYWFRMIDCMYEDCPGLRFVLGRLRFNKLIKAYLIQHPSRSFTLRNLIGALPEFLEHNPQLVEPHFDLALDMARFEWAQVVAFDGPARPRLSVDQLLGKDPAKLRVSLQPYLTLLDLRYPLDDFLIQLKKTGLRGEASNAMTDTQSRDRPRRRRSVRRPRRQTVFVVVHRFDNSLFYKRLDPRAYRILLALSRGFTLERALNKAYGPDANADEIKKWFATWSELGWFCKLQ